MRDGEDRVLLKRRIARLAVAYVVVTAALVAFNVATSGPSWWYFAAGGFGFALLMHALRVWRGRQA